MPRTLTKSRFRLAQECPTKLFYTGKPDLYPSTKLDDSFLAALAEGGFQVGELAKLYHPGGIEVEELGYKRALQQTAELLERDEVVLFEPAFLFEGLFIRVDVLVKQGDSIDLIEVKAKSCNGSGVEQFLTQKGSVLGNWRPYLEDVAFQKYVIEHAVPTARVRGHLMLADKSAVCPDDGLHQKFLLTKNERGRARVDVTAPLSQLELNQQILVRIDVDDVLVAMLSTSNWGVRGDESFDSWVAHAAREYAADARIDAPLGVKCQKCEYRANGEEKGRGMRNGFEECWLRQARMSPEELSLPTVLDIAGFSGRQKLIEAGTYRMEEVEQSDLKFDGSRSDVMSAKERKWLQVDRAQRKSNALELRKEGLKRELESWVYPLHFIDFETTLPAIPFHRGSSPYSQLAFQFSHHVVHEDGQVEHRGEFLDVRRAEFPNVRFLRALRSELDADDGTVFRYSPHENTILATLRDQLLAGEESDRVELIEFIESITQPRSGEENPWRVPSRNMVDLCEVVKKFIYDPRTNGSNSIKKVLPATLERSEFLQEKYSVPIYGAPDGISSLNFQSMTWVQKAKNGQLLDPYQLLPEIFTEATDEQLEALVTDTSSVKEGGAAMTAWARMQYTEMKDYERQELTASLLKYCELDTLAMVMLFEAWREWCCEDGA